MQILGNALLQFWHSDGYKVHFISPSFIRVSQFFGIFPFSMASMIQYDTQMSNWKKATRYANVYMPLGRFPRKKVFGGRTGNDAFYVSGRNQHGCTEKGVGIIDRKITLTRKQTKEIKEAGDILCSFHEFLRWNTYNYFVVKHLELHFLYERCSTNKVITTAPQYNNVN